MLKTVVNREPRVAGRVIEQWNGMDESGSIAVPELPHFAIAILATPLPENALITVGNRERRFLDYARARRPAGDVAPRDLRSSSHGHHSGLNAFEDRSPTLLIEPQTEFDAAEGRWIVEGDLKLRIVIPELEREHFLSQPTDLHVFVNERRVLEKRNPSSPAEIRLRATDLAAGEARVVVNWGSKLGPVAVNAVKVYVARDSVAQVEGPP